MMTRNNVHDPVLIDTVWGSVAVFGHELVSKKDLIILGECLSLPEFTIKQADHRVRSVVFRSDNRPYSSTTGRPILANCSFDAGAICINLNETFRVAVSNARDNVSVSVVASYHRNMILSFLHEIHHLAMLDGTPDNVEEAENEAEDWAWARLVQLAQTVNIEPAHFAESSFLNKKLSVLNSLDSWSHDQYNMMDNRVMYTIGLNGYFTFKGYIRLIAGGKESDPKWSKTIPTNSQDTVSKPVYVKPVPEYKLDEQVYIQVVQSAPTPQVEYEEEYPQYNNNYDDEGVTYEPIQSSPTPVQPPSQQPVVQQPPAQHSPLSENEIADIVIDIYKRCNAFIFDNCEPLKDSDLAFENPKKVSSNGIPLTELEQSIIIKMDCQDIEGRWCPTMSTVNGMLFGGVMKNTKLPYYKIFINMGAGVQKCRLLLPQNPATMESNGNYKYTAKQARAGNEILYIKEGDETIIKKNKETNKSDFYFKIVNRVFMKA